MPADLFDDAAEEADEGDELPADPKDDEPGENIAESEKEEEDAEGKGDQDSSEEEEGDDNEYDLTDKFIAAEDEEDEDEASEGAKERKRRRKRRREKSPELDEEDYQLLEENQVTGIRRKQKSERKRIRKQQDNENKTDAQRLQEELFGTVGDGGGFDDDVQEEARPAPVEEFDVSDDEMANFIDYDDMGRRTGRARAKGLPQGVSSHGLQEMQDIFGDVDDLLEMYAEKKATAVLGRDEEDDLADLEDEEDDAAREAAERQRAERVRQRKQKRIEDAIEPELMEKLMMLPLDERIRETDAPERFQLSGEMELRDAFTDGQLADAASWVLGQLIGPVPSEADDASPDSDVKSARQRHARFVFEDGIVEVDGKPRDGRSRRYDDYYEIDELEEGLTDLTRGIRGIRRRRSAEDRARWRRDPVARKAAVQAITNVLKEMWQQRHEIPLIACFRKELCGELLNLRKEDCPEMTTDRDVRRRRENKLPNFPRGSVQAKHRRLRRWDLLWAVHDLAFKWRALVRRKQKRAEVYKVALARCEALIGQQEGELDPQMEELRIALQSCIAETAEANCMEDVDDIDLKFKLVTSGHAIEVFEDVGSGTRRPKRSSAYSILKKAGLDEVVQMMAMSAADFGDNLHRYLKRHQPKDSRTMPIDLAYSHVTDDPAYDKPEKVLERVRQIHVSEIVCEPHVRAFVREQVDKHMKLSTVPTPAGEAQLDAFHPYGCVKRLRRKPIAGFDGSDSYLRIVLAEKEGLITLTSEVENMEELLVQPMLEYYKSSAVSAVPREWNVLRHAILRDAVQRLVPQMQEEAQSRLLNEAREHVVEEYTDKLWKYAAKPPVQITSEEGDVIERRRIAACCWGEGRPATCMVMLDDQGSLTDVLYLPSFSGQQRAVRQQIGYSIAEDPRKAADVKRIVEFCRDNRPQAILVGARNLFCKALKEDIGRINDFILDAHAQILTSGHDTGAIDVRYAEEVLADLWSNSTAAKEEFPDHPDVVRRAVALGRLSLEPLAVLASLCRSDGKEILSLNLHDLQSHVPEAELMKAAETALMTTAAQVGADINLMASNTWQASILPFIAGLGPRKAKSLLQAVQAHEFALNRVSLWNGIWKPGNTVFRNCGAFLKITAKARGLVNAEVEAIDSARIEPLSYKLAFEVARAAVGAPPGAQDDEENALNTSKAMAYSEKVEALDLEELHDQLAQVSGIPDQYNQISTLVDIAMEFIEPNMELRPGNIMEASQLLETQFWWMVGETPETLKQGRRVEALVKYVGQNEAKCVLPEIGGLEATLCASDISGSGVVNPSDHLRVGQSVTARVKAVKPEEFSVDLVTTSSDLNDDAFWEDKYSKGSDAYYHILTSEERRAIEVEKRRQARNKPLTKRTIDHPNFRNVTMSEAVKELERKGVGESIFWPSPKNVETICLTMKLHSGPEGDLIVHKDVKEGRKRGGRLTLGQPLTLLTDGNKKDERFEDLDEIMARFVEPLVDRFKQVVEHRKFRDGSWEDVKDALQSQTSQMQGGQAIYFLCINYLHPGVFYIGTVLPTMHRTPRREFFTASPAGFYFRHKVHNSIEKMLVVFKRNPVGKKQEAHPPAMGPPPMQMQQMQPQYGYTAAPLPYGYGAPAVGYNAYEPAPFQPNSAMYQ